MTLRPRDRIALVAVLILALAGAYYLLALTPEHNKAKTLDAAITTQRQALAQDQAQVAAGRAAQASLSTDVAEWKSIGLAVPAQSDIPALLRTLERAANLDNVKMHSITLTGSSSATASTAAASGGATGTPIQLSFAGGYVALDALVRRLDGFVVVTGNKVHATGPLLSISSVQLTGAPKLVAQLNATIYQLPASSATGGAATTGGK